MPKAPLELTLKLLRQDDADDPFAFRFQDQAYLRLMPDGTVSRRALFPWEKLQADLANLGQPTPDLESLQRLGDAMRHFLDGLGWKGDEERLSQALTEEAEGARRDILLTVQAKAAEMLTLPWELLSLPGSGKHFGLQGRCTVRYRWHEEAPRKGRAPTPKGRILFAWSAARSTVPFLEHEEAVHAACHRGDFPFDRKRDVLPHLSVPSLVTELKRAQEAGTPVTVLHLLCHGRQDASGVYGLVLDGAGAEKDEDFVDPGRLRDVLEPYAGSLQLVVLCACQGSQEIPGRHLGSVARELHRAGVPMVVASRLPLSWEGSIQLTQTLYGALLGVPEARSALLQAPVSLEDALGAARQRLREQGLMDWASLQLYTRADAGHDLRPLSICPYRGLMAFEPQHRRFFFGREELGQQLLERVQQAEVGQGPRFLAVAGASGSGKSSLVMAGLVPELRKLGWGYLRGRPSEDRLLEEVKRLGGARSLQDEKVLLLVDQFEEAFTRLKKAKRDRLMGELWALSRREDVCIVVVVTVRFDFFERAGEVPLPDGNQLYNIFCDRRHSLSVPQLAAAQYREIIAAPARLVGLEFSEGLVELLVKDVGHEPGALPLLEYALEQLWRQREGNRLTLEAYRKMGGVTGALARSVEELYEKLSEAERGQARRLLLELVDFRDDPALHTRRRVRFADVWPWEEQARAAFDAAVEKLVAGRFLLRTEADIEIAHEALIQHWPRLGEWIEKDRERLSQIRELRKLVDGHASRGDWLSGNSLGYALKVQEAFKSDLAEHVNWFINESHARFKEQQRQKEEQTQRLKDFARHAAAERLSEQDPTLALLVLREVNTDLEGIWTQTVLDVLRKPVSSAILEGHQGRISSVSFSPDGQRVLTVGSDGAARVWSADGRGEPRVLRVNPGLMFTAAFSPDGRRVVTAGEDGTAHVWDVHGGRLLAVLAGRGGRVDAMTFSADGQRVLAVEESGAVHLWRLDTLGPPVVLKEPQGFNSAAAVFSRDGARLVTASWDGTARVWKVDAPEAPVMLEGHVGSIYAVAFSADGTRVVTAGQDGLARVWSADVSRPPLVLRGHEGHIHAAAFSPDGQWVVTAGTDGTARVWRSDEEAAPVVLKGHQDRIEAVAFSPDGTRVVTASWDGTARVWRADGVGTPLVLKGHQGRVGAASFSPDGTWVATASWDGVARVWRVDGVCLPEVWEGLEDHIFSMGTRSGVLWVLTGGEDGVVRVWKSDGVSPAREWKGHERGVAAATFSPDLTGVTTVSWDGVVRTWRTDEDGPPQVGVRYWNGIRMARISTGCSRVLATGDDGVVRVWKVDGASPPVILEKPPQRISVATFSPDGTWVVMGGDDGVVRVWRTDVTGPPRLLEGHQGLIEGIAFSPDGTRVLTASWDGVVRVWRVDRQERPILLPGHQGRIAAVGFSPDGKQVVTGGDEGLVRVWRADGVGPPVILEGHQGRITVAAFSRDGKQVVAGGEDGSVRIWRADGGGQSVVMKERRRRITWAWFSPDGMRLVTTSDGGAIHVWPVGRELLHEHLREATFACLTPKQRQRYLLEAPEEARQRWEAAALHPEQQLRREGARYRSRIGHSRPAARPSSAAKAKAAPTPEPPSRLARLRSWLRQAFTRSKTRPTPPGGH